METTRASRLITDAPAAGCPSHLAGIRGGRPGLQGATMNNTRQTSQSAGPPSQEPYSQEMQDAWWRSRNAGLIQNAARNRPGPPSKLIPPPLAAYRLGLLSCSIWARNKGLWKTPGDQSTWFRVLETVSQLDEVRRILRREIDMEIYFFSLPRILDAFNRLTVKLIQAAQTTRLFNGARFGSEPVPGIELWQQLRALADDTLDEGSPLRPYYELGLALGEYQLKLWDLDHAAVVSNDLGLFPDILPVVERARQLPHDDVRRIPVLRAMVRSAPELNSGERATFYRCLLGENRDAFCRPRSAVSFETINQLARTLDSRIQEGLLRIALEPTRIGSGQQREKPSWRKSVLELHAEGRLVRDVARQAKHMIKILDTFEEERWPRKIDDPLPKGPHVPRLQDAVHQLNKGQTTIRFGTHKGRSVTWKWVTPPELPGELHAELHV
jgi:hypothetical protein